MASAPFDISTSTPGDSSIVSQFPANERTMRDIVESYLNTEHDFNTGYHKYVTFVDQNGTEPTFASGYSGLYNDAGVLMWRTASGTALRVEMFAAATKLLFPQSTAPTGWVKDTDVDDKVIMVTNGTPGTGGSWTISGITVNDHVLTESEMPSHEHSIVRGATGNTGAASDKPLAVQGLSGSDAAQYALLGVSSGSANVGKSSTAGSDAGHDHGLTIGSAWRPAYLEVIKCTKS